LNLLTFTFGFFLCWIHCFIVGGCDAKNNNCGQSIIGFCYVFFLSNQNFKNQCLYDLFVLNVFTNCETLYVFASFINQDSNKHDFETSKDFEETNQEDSREIKDIKGFGNL